METSSFKPSLQTGLQSITALAGGAAAYFAKSDNKCGKFAALFFASLGLISLGYSQFTNRLTNNGPEGWRPTFKAYEGLAVGSIAFGTAALAAKFLCCSK